MAVYKRGYQRYDGPLTSHATRVLAVPRFAWDRLMQQRLVVVLTMLSLIWPLLCGGFIYVANHLDLLKGFGGNDLGKMVEINGRFFLTFMQVQAVFSVLLSALTGPGLIAPDLANNALPLYFSRPLTRVDYVGARMAVLVALLSMVTWIPGLFLFIMQSSMAGGNWFAANWNLGLAIVCGFLLWIALLSMVALACSAWVKWRIIAGALVLAFFFILAGVSEMVNSILRVDFGTLFNPARSMFTVWAAMLGVEPPRGPDAWECVSVLAGLVVLLAFVLERKLRPVEVIS
jgi:ABC-2 type transport system permease protein